MFGYDCHTACNDPNTSKAEVLFSEIHSELRDSLQSNELLHRCIECWAEKQEQSVNRLITQQQYLVSEFEKLQHQQRSRSFMPPSRSFASPDGTRTARSSNSTPKSRSSLGEALALDMEDTKANNTNGPRGTEMLSQSQTRQTFWSSCSSESQDDLPAVPKRNRFSPSQLADARLKRLSTAEKDDMSDIITSHQAEEYQKSRCRCLNTSARQRIRKLVRTQRFELFCGILILTNAALIGIETEYIASSVEGRIPGWCNILQNFLNLWYILELSLRLFSERKDFFVGDNKLWNLFDCVLIATSLFDLVIAAFSGSNFTMGRVFRAIRLCRIIRMLRIARQLQAFREFRKMVFSLLASGRTLIWSVVLLLSVIYIFALWFTQSASIAIKELPAADTVDVIAYYGSIGRTTYTLFRSITNGISWGLCLDVFIQKPVEMYASAALFIIFIWLSVLGVLNVVAAVFVDCAMQSTQQFKDLLVQERVHKNKMYCEHVKRIFKQIDADGSGSISFREMEAYVQDVQTEMHAYLEALELNVSDTYALFRLIDTDASGSINIEEFVEGCLRLKGEARSFDINCMMYESRQMLRHWADFMSYCEGKFGSLEDVIRLLTSNMNEYAVRSSALHELQERLRSSISMPPSPEGRSTPPCDLGDPPCSARTVEACAPAPEQLKAWEEAAAQAFANGANGQARLDQVASKSIRML